MVTNERFINSASFNIFMGGGLDVLVVGVGGRNLDHIAPHEQLDRIFGDKTDSDDAAEIDAAADRYFKNLHALAQDPATPEPKIFYFKDECVFGAGCGAVLGYVLFDGNNNGMPKKVDERVFARIPELQERFLKEMDKAGIKVEPTEVGVYAFNVYDT